MKELEAGGPSVSLGQLGGPSRHSVLRASFPQPLDQPVLLSSPKYLSSSLLLRWEQNLEIAN